MEYSEPGWNKTSFTCPNCQTITQQEWKFYKWYGAKVDYGDGDIGWSTCQHCKKTTVWVGNQILYPNSGLTILPNTEMPESVSELFKEAADIFYKSPRGSAALLRLGIQQLCIELGEEGKNINKDIANLVKKGLPDIVQKSLDAVRVIGNNAVHPGQIDTDDPDVVMSLFDLTNVIVEYMIALPNKVTGLYGSLPQSARDAIDRRDK